MAKLHGDVRGANLSHLVDHTRISFQDHLGNHHGDKKSGKSVLSRPSTKCAKNGPKSGSSKAIEPQNVHKKGSFKTIEDGSKKDTSFKTIANRVNNLNPQYMVPVDEATQVISDPQTRKKAQPVTEQPSSRSTTSRITDSTPSMWSQDQCPSTVPGIFKHCSPTALTALGDMQGEYDIKTDLRPNCPSSPTQKVESSH